MQEKSPEQLAAEAQAKEARKRYLAAVQNAINSDNPDVREVLRYVANLSGFFANPVALSAANGDVLVSGSVYNMGRESLYHDLRKMMSAGTKNIIERSE